ncbi:Hypothetical_protein [Hexamita inflata]|uniref:Hypothetical_protein n=1 Tax=Hexamita inflata TaxID=28002 RepID=A0ABP1HCJ0_9EUKA
MKLDLKSNYNALKKYFLIDVISTFCAYYSEALYAIQIANEIQMSRLFVLPYFLVREMLGKVLPRIIYEKDFTIHQLILSSSLVLRVLIFAFCYFSHDKFNPLVISSITFIYTAESQIKLALHLCEYTTAHKAAFSWILKPMPSYILDGFARNHFVSFRIGQIPINFVWKICVGTFVTFVLKKFQTAAEYFALATLVLFEML